MNILSMKHDVSEGHSLDKYVADVESALGLHRGEVDIFLGPDYALYPYLDGDHVAGSNLTKEAFDNFVDLSRNYSSIVLIPGTMPLTSNGCMSHSAPVIYNGNVSFFNKETNCDEEERANRYGYEYVRGDSSLNHFEHSGKRVLVSICGDRGKQNIPDDTFVELIPAYDQNAGFSEGKSRFVERYGIVSNGYTGETFGGKFDPFSKPRLKPISPIEETADFGLFTLV